MTTNAREMNVGLTNQLFTNQFIISLIVLVVNDLVR